MERLKITKIVRYREDKEGRPLMTKDGRQYTRVLLRTDKYDKSISGFENADNKSWKEGDEIEVEVVQKSQYLNFLMPKRIITRQEFEGLEDRVKLLEERVYKLTPQEFEEQPPIIDDADTPF